MPVKLSAREMATLEGKRKPPQDKEQAIQKSIISFLNAHGIFCWRQNQGAMKGTYKGKDWFIRFASVKGISDIIGIMPNGKFLAIEVKRPGEKATLEQNAFICRIAKNFGVAFVATSVADVESILREWL